MFRKILLSVGSLLLATQLAAADEKTKGKLAIWLGYPETQEAFKLGAAEFKKQYPNVDVEILTFELTEFQAKLAVAVPTGAGPDILALHDFIFPRYYEAGSLADMPDDLVKAVNDPKVIDPVFKDVVTREDKPWGLPWWTGRNALFYNIDDFKAAGLKEPPKTLAELWDDAEKLTKKGPDGQITRAGISLRLTGPSGGTQKFGYMYYQVTGQQILEKGKQDGTVRITLKDNLEAAAKLLVDNVNHLHGEKKSDDWSLKHDAQGFASGAASMFYRESWVIPFVKTNGPNINFGVAPVPRDKAWGSFNLIEILAVNKDSKLQQAAWDFIRILQSQPILDNVLTVSGWVPLRHDRDYSAMLAKEPRYEPLLNAPAGYSQYIEVPNPAYEEVTVRIGEIIQAAYRDASLVNNVEGAKKVILRAQDTATKILKEQGIYSD